MKLQKSDSNFKSQTVELTTQQPDLVQSTPRSISVSGGRKYCKSCSRRCKIASTLAVLGILLSAAATTCWVLLGTNKKLQNEHGELAIVATGGTLLGPLCLAFACLAGSGQCCLTEPEGIPYQALANSPA